MDDHALNRLARRYPKLDLQCLCILAMVSESAGLSMSDIAETMGMDHRYVQFHVSMMSTGKKGREKNGLDLVLIEDDLFDKRRKRLRLTEAGERVIKSISPLTK